MGSSLERELAWEKFDRACMVANVYTIVGNDVSFRIAIYCVDVFLAGLLSVQVQIPKKVLCRWTGGS